MNLFDSIVDENNKNSQREFQPLAERMRPRNLDEFIGQQNVIKGSLRRMIEAGNMPSMIFYGLPGTGKTTLAKIIANTTKSHFKSLNAALSGIADIRNIIKEAENQRKFYQKQTILFIDEIHRFNKSQQDVLLPYVEDGRLILIGATTENPFFEVNPALLSRVKIVKLNRLTNADIVHIIEKAIKDEERGFGKNNLKVEDKVIDIIADFANGDARTALNILEQAALNNDKITVDVLSEILGSRAQHYDKNGNNHFDVISAFIKSMRGSDPDAAIFYLAKMLVGGEDINYIARRIVICAAEDVGNADPMALILANAAAQAAQFVGLPEARIPLAQAVIYIAGCKKSNAAYLAIDAAIEDVKSKDCGEVPIHLRDTSYKGAKYFHNGEGYMYPHDYENHFVEQQYLPDKMIKAHYYEPVNVDKEAHINEYLKACWPKRFS
ncbi:MAG: replication-associated recombination protein A [Selenomonadaceae bacterium]|nr:replication-associated recombination protein A [Selenomonadaceae bacterium]MBR1858076.1 replication-associated recombination protein A [Selenomonadaceae bacterium]